MRHIFTFTAWVRRNEDEDYFEITERGRSAMEARLRLLERDYTVDGMPELDIMEEEVYEQYY